VERTFPVHSPKIERIEIAARGDVRRAKLYYLRERVGKRARVRERRAVGAEEAVEAGLLYAPEEEEPPVEEGEMPVDDEAPREGEVAVAVEAEAEAEAEAGSEAAEPAVPEPAAAEQSADDGAREAAPDGGDGERE